jgi:hypothetical protein
MHPYKFDRKKISYSTFLEQPKNLFSKTRTLVNDRHGYRE